MAKVTANKVRQMASARMFATSVNVVNGWSDSQIKTVVSQDMPVNPLLYCTSDTKLIPRLNRRVAVPINFQ